MVFAFEEYELDPERYELRGRQGESIPVEPQVLELLDYLIRHRDRLVSKQELLDEVWGGRFVGDAALSRCIYQARRAIGDGDREEPLIRTVIGRGYRFVGDVEVRSAPPGRDEAVPAEPQDTGGRGLRPRRLVAWLIPLLLAAGLVVWWSASGRSVPPPQSAGADSATGTEVALLPIAVPVDSSGLELLALSLTDLLWARLASVPGILVRSPESSAEAVSIAGGLAAFTARAEVGSLVRGTLEESPGGSKAILRVTLAELASDGRLVETPVGGSFELPVPGREIPVADFVRVRDAVTRSLLERLLPAVSLTHEEAPDAEAYRLYLTARQRLQARHCDGAALSMIDRSVALDPGQPLAWYLLASASYSQVWACGADATHFERALTATRHARGLAPHLLESQMLESTILVETGEIEEAYSLLRELAAEHPERAELRFEPAYPLRYAGFLEPAEALIREGLSIDPLYISTASTGMTPNVFLYRNDFDEFLHYLPDSTSSYHLYYRGFVELLRGDDEAARAALEPAFRSHPTAVFGRLSQALLSFLDGEHEAAAAIVKQVALQRRDLGARDGERSWRWPSSRASSVCPTSGRTPPWAACGSSPPTSASWRSPGRGTSSSAAASA
ncbi:MAG: winged helix-turn-helix domain-containing protein [Thermoanaerobaculia bacterium]